MRQLSMMSRLMACCLSLILYQYTASAQTAAEILQAAGVRGGVVVHVGCGKGELTLGLHANDSYLVHGIDTSQASVDAARKLILASGKYGRVTIDIFDGSKLPYRDNMVNLLVADTLGAVDKAEVMRVLVPNGVAYLKENGSWQKTVKPRPDNIDEWTHYLHNPTNNAVAQDDVVGSPKGLQWLGGPKWSRHHDHMSSMNAMVSAGGRIFYMMDDQSRESILFDPEWSLNARDAFNGTNLWSLRIPKWHTHMTPLKSGPADLPRRLVAIGDKLYATLGIDASASCLDAATGELIRTYAPEVPVSEIIYAEGVLFLVGKPLDATQDRAAAKRRGESGEGPSQQLLAVQADTGEILWKLKSDVLRNTLCLNDTTAFFHDGEAIVSIDRKTGKKNWTSAPIARRPKLEGFYAPTLVVYKDVVLFSGGQLENGNGFNLNTGGGNDEMAALSVGTGNVLWRAPHPPSGYKSAEDILVVGGLVWTGETTSSSQSGKFTGRDPNTGEVKKEFLPDVDTYWFHHRCYRAKATRNLLLTSRTGIEFLDYKKETWQTNHWVRGACLYGVMPANGMVYAPPNPCACYPEAKLFGMNALSAVSMGTTTDEVGRLQKGPAYDSPLARAPATADWPTYRGDEARSGWTHESHPTTLSASWRIPFNERTTPPVAAGGKVFVATPDSHSIHAINAADGARLWSFTAGGTVNSPPTIYGNRVVFGGADGVVYCLRAEDGALIWRFRGAPRDMRMVAFNQIESVWPVDGSVLVTDIKGRATACFVAGRSMFLDGGMRMLMVDVMTGEKIVETVLDNIDPNNGKDLQSYIKVLNMPVALPDILSRTKDTLFMRTLPFNLQGTRDVIGLLEGDQLDEGAHIFAPNGFLDTTWWHRTYWVYGRDFYGGHNGYYVAGKATPSGRMITEDDDNVYIYGRKPQYYKWTTPIEYRLFSAQKIRPAKAAVAAAPAAPGKAPRKPSAGSGILDYGTPKQLNPSGTALTVAGWVNSRNGNGVIVAHGGPAAGYALYIADGIPQFAVRAGSVLAAATGDDKIKTGEWVHLAGIMTDEQVMTLYVNGEPVGKAMAASLIDAAPKQGLQIGGDDGSAVGDYTSPFLLSGSIDDVVIYHRMLSKAEIKAHAAGTVKLADSKPDFAVTFDDNGAEDTSHNKLSAPAEKVQWTDGPFGKAARFAGVSADDKASGGKGKNGKAVPPAQPAYAVNWQEDVPFFVRAMVLTGTGADKTMFIAGPPDLLDEEDAVKHLNDERVHALVREQAASVAGLRGAKLRAVSSRTGKTLAEYDLDFPPIFDGMIAAEGKIFMSLSDNSVGCWQ